MVPVGCCAASGAVQAMVAVRNAHIRRLWGIRPLRAVTGGTILSPIQEALRYEECQDSLRHENGVDSEDALSIVSRAPHPDGRDSAWRCPRIAAAGRSGT